MVSERERDCRIRLEWGNRGKERGKSVWMGWCWMRRQSGAIPIGGKAPTKILQGCCRWVRTENKTLQVFVHFSLHSCIDSLTLYPFHMWLCVCLYRERVALVVRVVPVELVLVGRLVHLALVRHVLVVVQLCLLLSFLLFTLTHHHSPPPLPTTNIFILFQCADMRR